MVALPAVNDPTLEAVDRAIEARAAAETPRPYLGMSQLGESCERRLWYSFRWAVAAVFPAATLYRFEDGFRVEEVIAQRLRLVRGVTLHTLDPVTGKQFEFVDIGEHLRGHVDGMIRGLLQAPQTWHVWECKATSEDNQAKLIRRKTELGEKDALAAWNPTYYAQAVLYMHYAALQRHYLTCASPGARWTVSVRTEANPDAVTQLRAKAERIITRNEPRPRISADPAHWQCKSCPAQAICHGTALPAVNCRTCVHATAETDGDGRWHCARWNDDIPLDTQRTGCEEHRYLPPLVRFAEPVDADPAANWIEYRMPDGRTFRNGARADGGYASDELRVLDPTLIGDAFVEEIRRTFDARAVELSPPVVEPPPLPPMHERPFKDWTRPQTSWRST